jgi:hypothetical protein
MQQPKMEEDIFKAVRAFFVLFLNAKPSDWRTKRPGNSRSARLVATGLLAGRGTTDRQNSLQLVGVDWRAAAGSAARRPFY